MSSSTPEAPSARALWEREYEEVHAYTTSYRDELDRGVWFLLGWLRARGREPSTPILECACGRGRNLLPLAARGYRGLGLDHASAALQRFRERAREERPAAATAAVRHDLREPFPIVSESIGTVLDITAIDNLAEPEQRERYAAEVARVLRPEGLFVVVTFDRDDGYYARFLAAAADPAEGVVRDPNTGVHNRLFRGSELDGLFQAAGLDRVAAQRFDFADEAGHERWMRRFLLRLYRKPE